MSDLLLTAIMLICGGSIILAIVFLVAVISTVGALVWADIVDGSHVDGEC